MALLNQTENLITPMGTASLVTGFQVAVGPQEPSGPGCCAFSFTSNEQPFALAGLRRWPCYLPQLGGPSAEQVLPHTFPGTALLELKYKRSQKGDEADTGPTAEPLGAPEEINRQRPRERSCLSHVPVHALFLSTSPRQAGSGGAWGTNKYEYGSKPCSGSRGSHFVSFPLFPFSR